MNNKTASIRRKATFNLRDLPDFHTKALVWAATFPLCTALDSNHYEKDSHHRYDQLIAVGEEVSLQAKRGEDSFEQLKKWHKKEEDWLFGYLSYDLKNEVEKLVSNNKNVLQWPDMLFFQPSVVLAFEEAELTVHSIHLKPELVVSQICNQIVNENEKQIPKPVIKSGMTKEYYLKSVEAVRQHIIAGDLYEMNLCQEFFAEN
ncbi:MAG: para-aminobenzoate synthetase component 1, partial [Nonlabens sp.]